MLRASRHVHEAHETVGASSAGPARAATRTQAVAPITMAPMLPNMSVQVSPAPPISARPLRARKPSMPAGMAVECARCRAGRHGTEGGEGDLTERRCEAAREEGADNGGDGAGAAAAAPSPAPRVRPLAGAAPPSIHDAGPSSDAAPGSAEAQSSQRTARRPSAPPSPFSTPHPSCSPSEHRPETYEFRNRL